MKKKKKQERVINEKLDTKRLTAFKAEMTDPDGSYTGVPRNRYEKPVQDVDDL